MKRFSKTPTTLILVCLGILSVFLFFVIFMADSKTLKVGDKAPDFTLNDAEGTPVRLSSFFGKKNIVLYFYPKDETPGCTAQACSFRDSYETFRDLGAEVIGISGDDAASHQNFVKKHRLPFVLLSDNNNEVRKKYGVPSTFFLIPGRVTFVIDKEGTVRHIFNSQFKAEEHVTQAMDVLNKI